MKKIFLAAFLTAAIPSFTLETKPWFGDVYAFDFQSAFSYSRFNKVQGASKQLSAPLNNCDLLLDLGFTLSPAFDLQLEGEFGRTTLTNSALRSGAVQVRYQVLDDISGDPVSLVFGWSARGATHHFLKDVSTPYAAEFNTELTCSVGKEWSQQGVWTIRTYGFVAVGQGNRGYPWTRGLYVWQYNLDDTHRFTAFADADCGFGNKQHVNVKHFSGWGKFQHQSIDLGVGYGYKIGLYGVLTASYAHRVYAHNSPEHVNFFILAYTLPFSLF
jgi:hypothetical protein